MGVVALIGVGLSASPFAATKWLTRACREGDESDGMRTRDSANTPGTRPPVRYGPAEAQARVRAKKAPVKAE